MLLWWSTSHSNFLLVVASASGLHGLDTSSRLHVYIPLHCVPFSADKVCMSMLSWVTVKAHQPDLSVSDVSLSHQQTYWVLSVQCNQGSNYQSE